MKKSAKKSPKKKPCKTLKRTNAAQAKTKKKEAEVEQPTVLTKEIKKAVEKIMLLPHSMRWKAGAKDWTVLEQAYAKGIEKKRISEERMWSSAILDWY